MDKMPEVEPDSPSVWPATFLALLGGALLSLGSWVFMLSVFAGGFAAAFFLRRVWR